MASLDQAVGLHGQGRLAEAERLYAQILAAAPDHADARHMLGVLRAQQGRPAEALDPALAQAPLTGPSAICCWAISPRACRCMNGAKQMPQPMEARVYPQPLWTGAQDLSGKTLFAYSEQGLGDTIQFYRYVRFVLDRGAKVILSVPDQLIALLQSATPKVALIGWGKAPAHLAGALGVPAWIALKYVPEWRWFLARNDSVWYPSLRLFRQPATGDWAGVFAAMEAELRGAVHQR